MADTYRASRRDEAAIWLANRILRLLASRRCVELISDVFRRGINPLGSGSYDPVDYTGLFDYEDSDLLCAEGGDCTAPAVSDDWYCQKHMGGPTPDRGDSGEVGAS